MFSSPVKGFISTHDGAVLLQQSAMLYKIKLDPSTDQLKSGVTFRVFPSITE